MFLETETIRLRKTTVQDLEFVCSLESDQENAKFIIPWSRERHEKSLRDKDIMHLMVEDKSRDVMVGYIILAGLTSPNDSIELMRITISEKGKGYGSAAFKLIKHWAFDIFHANRLWLDVKVNNERALHLYKKQGFVIEGTLRECLKNKSGAYESLHVMSILRSEYNGTVSSI